MELSVRQPDGICGFCRSPASESPKSSCRRPTMSSAQALLRVDAGSHTSPMSQGKKRSTSGASLRRVLNGKFLRGGGIQPRFARDGKELFYVSADRKIMSVPVKTDGASFESGTPRTVFEAHIILKEERPGSQ